MIGVVGAVATVWAAYAVGLYMPGRIFRGWIATVDYANALFMILWASTLIGFGANDGRRYHIRFGSRIRRTSYSDAVVIALFAATGALWGELVLRPVMNGRAIDPAYLRHVPAGMSVDALASGVTVVIVTYYAALGLVFAVNLLGMRFNPVDLDYYTTITRRPIRFGRPSERPTTSEGKEHSLTEPERQQPWSCAHW
ncbi:hypothetical protein IF188_17785 [Microbacterium sp. NEAU-LLC]|uniref:C4-dicarboxylate ABC transporter permease n=1 Tax=Microbacterium helvum TaxID=2773713 RepID=A0ABR8NSD0_9MICO|nr:hypothetical protein [Microbacterium helvum]MBD3943546.1 hypothetical protein [Microbacterium helvum]